MKIVHISECSFTPTSGMGRIQYNWNKELTRKGHLVLSVGPEEVGQLKHPLFFPYKAKSYLNKLALTPDAIICHEPASGVFVNNNKPVFLVSHGVENRYWDLSIKGEIPNTNAQSAKTRILFPIWRLYNCNQGLRYAHKLLLSNNDDANYVQIKFKRKSSDIHVFKNGYNTLETSRRVSNDTIILLWNATWLDRKGKHIFLEALHLLADKGNLCNCILAGTGSSKEEILDGVREDVKDKIQVVPSFSIEDEHALLIKSDIFVLPSYFEGLPLSLIQAMSSGICCITSDNCGQKDIIVNNENGLLFKTGDARDLANKIEIAINNISVRERLSLNAMLSVKDWTWEKVSANVVQFIESSL